MIIERRRFLAGAALATLPMRLPAQEARPLKIAATNLRMPNAFLNVTAAAPGFKYRTLHIVGAPVAELVFGFCGWAVPSNIEVDASAPHRYDKISVEIGNRTVPVTFDGARSVTIAGGVPWLLSDPVAATDFELAIFARDQPFYLRAAGIAAVGRTLPMGTPATGFEMRFSSFAPAAAIDDVDATGPIRFAPGTPSRPTAPGPCLVLGRVPQGSPAVICTGDSIADGAGDNAHLTTGFGFFNRAALDTSGRDAIASLNLTKYGSSAGTLAANLGIPGAPGFAYRQAMLGFGNVLVDEYGANTLGTSKLSPASGVIDRARGLWALARSAGIERIVRTTLLPRSRSTNAFVDAANQTPAINWREGEARDQINAAFAGYLGAGDIDVLADLVPAVADIDDDNRWASNKMPFFMTRDGTHPTSNGHRPMAQLLRNAYAGLSVG